MGPAANIRRKPDRFGAHVAPLFPSHNNIDVSLTVAHPQIELVLGTCMGNEPIILRFFGCITAFRLSPSPSRPLTFPPLIGLCPLLGRIVCALRFNEEKVFENRWIFTHEWWISTIYVDIETKRSSSNILARRGDASSSWKQGDSSVR